MKNILVENFKVSTLKIPTENALESDGTLEWNSTTMILIELQAQSHTGIGYTYGHRSISLEANDLLKAHVVGKNAIDTPNIWGSLTRAIRNDGRQGLTSMAISAIDNALWDLKSKILKVSLVDLLGASREKVEGYGSGGFTSLSLPELKSQLESWQSMGLRKFKIKVGTHPEEDAARVRFAKEAIGPDHELMVDANEAYQIPQALKLAHEFSASGVTWFEQPIHSMDFEGMRELKSKFPIGMKLTTGEYIYEFSKLVSLLKSRSADVIQLDVTRCQGVTGFLKCAALCEANHIPISSHCTPALHVALGCAVQGMQHIEYFSDHARIENMIFEGAPKVKDGFLNPNREAHGFGLTPHDFKRWLI